jgi:PhzF family phenazine biosynthesis protein
VVDAEGLATVQMQGLASWTNLSETVFLLPPTQPAASYRVRIFTPRAELPFAGHPTIGSAHAALEVGLMQPGRSMAQECGAGVLPLRVEETEGGRWIFVEAPQPRLTAWDDVGALQAALGASVNSATPPVVVDVGPRWVVAAMDPQDLRALEPDMAALASVYLHAGATGVTVFALGGADCAVSVRSFAPAEGIPEDPVCGSGNISVAAFLRQAGLLKETGDTYTASQGRELGRDGRVRIKVTPEAIQLGGQAVTVIEGEIHL